MILGTETVVHMCQLNTAFCLPFSPSVLKSTAKRSRSCLLVKEKTYKFRKLTSFVIASQPFLLHKRKETLFLFPRL